MKWIYLCLIALSYASGVHSEGGGYFAGGRMAALGRSSVTLTEVWSGVNNQAGLAWTQGWQVGLFVENRFLMKEVCREAVGLSWSGKPGALGLSLSYFGFQLYHQLYAGISYARKFGKRFSAGVQINYFRMQIAEGYGAQGVFSCEAGMIYKPDQHWTIGMQVRNPIPVKLTKEPDERLPAVFRLGAGYDISGKVLILLEGEKDLENPLIVRSGVEVRMAKSLYGRIGMHTEPFAVTGGIGISLGKLIMDFATEYHTSLGFSPAIGLEYSFGKKGVR